MKTTAAVLVELGRPLEVADLDVPALKPGQVLVEVAFSGVCHTQILEARGHRGEDRFLPHCLGHEGSGIVREIGAGVTKVKPGDSVILSWIKGSGADVPGTVYGWNGRTVNAGAITTFATHSVISENRLTVIPEGLSMRHAALVGCAVPTGAGVVFNTAQPRPGQSLVGIRHRRRRVVCYRGRGALRLSSRDRGGREPGQARACEATRRDAHCEPEARRRRCKEILGLCKGGADFAIEATGNPAVMRQSLACVRPQGGAAVIVGNAKHGQTLEIDPRELNQGKRLLGTWGGDNVPDRDYPRYGKLIAAGKLNVEPLLGRTYSLLDVNAALDDLERGLLRAATDRDGASLCLAATRTGATFRCSSGSTSTTRSSATTGCSTGWRSNAISFRDELPPTKQAVRDFLRATGREADWTELQGIAYGPRIADAEPFPGVKTIPLAMPRRASARRGHQPQDATPVPRREARPARRRTRVSRIAWLLRDQ